MIALGLFLASDAELCAFAPTLTVRWDPRLAHKSPDVHFRVVEDICEELVASVVRITTVVRAEGPRAC